MPLPLAFAIVLAAARYALKKFLTRILPKLIKRFGSYVVLAMIAAMKDELKKWLEKWLPPLVIYYVNKVTGLSLDYPITGASITRAINERLGEEIFTDITDRDAVQEDVGRYAMKRLNDALGTDFVRSDFKTTMTARRSMSRKMRVFTKKEIKRAWTDGSGAIMRPEEVAATLKAARGDYDWKPHVNIDDVQHQVGREMAKWARAHWTRNRVPR